MAGAVIAAVILLLSMTACSTPEAPASSVSPVELGLACSSDAGCTSGLCVEETHSGSAVSWTAGVCTELCSTTNVCPTGSTCVEFNDGSSLCLTHCATGNDCRSGYICANAVNACLPDCRLGFSCGSTLTCDQGTGACVAKIGSESIGAPCTLDSDCKSGVCTPEKMDETGTEWTGGYCTQPCGAAAPCADAAACITYADGTSYCAAACTADSNCRAGYVCSATAKACLPDCRAGWSCGSSLRCDVSTGNCVGKMLAIGSACTSNTDCASGICTAPQGTTSGTAWTDGYCTQACSATVSCAAPAVCVNYADGTSYCASHCAADADCRTGYVCATSIGACLPDCRLGWSCGTLVCSTSSGTCG